MQFGDFERLHDHIEELLGERRIDDRGRSETLLVFEALYNDMVMHGISKDTPMTVWRAGSFGDVHIKLAFEGKPYVPMSGVEEDPSIESKIMAAYAEKIEYRYQSGKNILILTTRRSVLGAAWNFLTAFVLAVLSFILIIAVFKEVEQQEQIGRGIRHMEELFTDAMLSVAAPVTFFSLLRNLTNMFVLGEGNSPMRRIEARALFSSAVSVLLALCMSFAMSIPLVYLYFGLSSVMSGMSPNHLNVKVVVSLSEIFDSFVSSSIFEPFETFSPFPTILLAIITTYAFRSAGSYFDGFRKVVEGLYVLFSRMLTAVMYTLPFFFYLALLDGMLRKGPEATVFMAGLLVLVPVSMIAMVLFYAVRLKIVGIRPVPFMKKLVPLIRENLLINSTIDAVPFNVRYCVSVYKVNRKKLGDYLTFLAQANLNGNCFVITLLGLLLMLAVGKQINSFDLIVVCVLVFFLSLGAPKQPGSILIGLLVILSYLNALDFVAMAICSEVFFGHLVSITNAVGDIVTVAVTDTREKARNEASRGLQV